MGIWTKLRQDKHALQCSTGKINGSFAQLQKAASSYFLCWTINPIICITCCYESAKKKSLPEDCNKWLQEPCIHAAILQCTACESDHIDFLGTLSCLQNSSVLGWFIRSHFIEFGFIGNQLYSRLWCVEWWRNNCVPSKAQVEGWRKRKEYRASPSVSKEAWRGP